MAICNVEIIIFFLRRRFILHRKKQIYKKIPIYFTKSIYTYNKCETHNIHADILTSISIGPSCTAYILLMIDCECQWKLSATYI